VRSDTRDDERPGRPLTVDALCRRHGQSERDATGCSSEGPIRPDRAWAAGGDRAGRRAGLGRRSLTKWIETHHSSFRYATTHHEVLADGEACDGRVPCCCRQD